MYRIYLNTCIVCLEFIDVWRPKWVMPEWLQVNFEQDPLISYVDESQKINLLYLYYVRIIFDSLECNWKQL